MKLLLLIFILPLAASSEELGKKKNPNDEPFLPINPGYLYSPKLTKRGVEKDINEMISQLSPELYPRQSSSPKEPTLPPNYNENYQRGIPANIALIQSSSLSSSGLPISYNLPPAVPMRTMLPPIYGPVTQSPRQGNPLYATGQNGFSTYYNSMSQSNQPSAVLLQQQQQAQMMPQYNQYQSQQSPPQVHNYYSTQQQQPAYMSYSPAPTPQDDQENQMMLMEMPDDKYTRQRGKIQDSRITSDMKDGEFMDGINYISSNPKDLETQPTTYKQPSSYNSLDGQSDLHLRSAQLPRNQLSNLQLPANYKRQLDHIMSQTLAKLLMENGGGNSQYDFNQTPVKPLTQPGQIIAKTGLAYVMNPSTFHVSPRHVSKSPDSTQVLQVSPGGYGKIRKPGTSVSVEASQSYYIQPVKSVKNHHPGAMDFANYDYPGGQGYESEAVPVFDSNKTMQGDEVYSSYPGPPMFEFSNYHHPRQMLRNFKTTLDDGNYEAKRSSKRSPKFLFSS